MSLLKSPQRCYDCDKGGDLFRYSCSHSFCVECTLVYVFARLRSFYFTLKNNTSALENCASFLGCKLMCEQGKLSLSLRFLTLHVGSSNKLSQEQKILFTEYSELGTSFFSGLTCKFFICSFCKSIKSNLKCKLLLCKNCISGLVQKQISRKPKGIFIDWQEEESEFHAKDSMFSDYTLIQYNAESETYNCEQEGDVLRMLKLVKYNEKCTVCLVRAISVCAFNIHYIEVENHAYTVQNVALITLVG